MAASAASRATRRHLLLALALLTGVPSGTARQPGDVPTAPQPAQAMQDFLAAYWDADAGYFLAWNRGAPFPRPTGAGPAGGRYSDFWWEAQLWDLVLDAATRDPADARARSLIGAVYDGFDRAYPEWSNDYNDDLGWWAQAAMRAYVLTGETRYLDRARSLFAAIWASWTPDGGGGVLWRRSGGDQKNVATNAPLAVTAVRLYQATGDSTYLTRARALYAFVDEHLTDGGARVYDNIENGELRRWEFTYNIGNVVLAALALREVTAEPAERADLLSRATRATDWALDTLTNAGVLLDEGAGDGAAFKGVFLRALHTLSLVPELGAAPRERYAASLRDQATQVWNVRRPSDGLVGSDWSAPQVRGVIESVAAASAVTALVLAPPPLTAQFVEGDRRYEAENSARAGVASSAVAAGYSGRGYVNAFFKDGQFVDFHVTVKSAGPYWAHLRYSAGGGTATRTVVVNGAPGSQDFPATSGWLAWTEQVVPMALSAGVNHVRVAFDRHSGSRGWLNLDRLVLGDHP
ncbi:putative alpha-1,6-mannanase (GH76 family) [Deinococcus metalli]|uniref:Putative alpha-1,6-mannanase (GH76 family) n=1 Tax=Deinococcus metalli TaxID=1141878 RepID=A0A7W8KGE8_9DEIO|nr:glycoside hydrolase family 76 protein [Deinococcus metalli]MBB5376531.1 putative alpha-1,6-mannanase (GH76 family) [Deinococcus metalli]GHF43326.1 hypothetical protein GCM10017781_19700 [Deinococcus metalli]